MPVRYKVIGIVVTSQLVLGLAIAWWVSTALGQWLSYLMEEERVVQAMNAGTRGVIVVTLVAAVGGLALAWLLTVALTDPILHLARLARKVAGGNLGVRSPVWANDEVGYLARSFNSMVDALSDSRAAIVKSNEELSTSNQELRDLWEDLKRKEEMRVSLLARAVSAQEAERLRLSRELHDGTGQMLATALVHLKVLERIEDRAAAHAKIAELREIIVQTLEECRRLSMDLRPAGLDDLGLPDALSWLARDFQASSGIAVTLNVEGMSERLARPIEVELYRIAQEMLSNVAKHARARRVDLHLAAQGDTATLTVADDGIGFDAQAALSRYNRGLGLLSMRERTELLGGTFQLESTPGQGTRISIAVPATLEVTA
ncbi:MAG: HAMP domain-containing sensor histidine kinase [Chloroflexota bacterium]